MLLLPCKYISFGSSIARIRLNLVHHIDNNKWTHSKCWRQVRDRSTILVPVCWRIQLCAILIRGEVVLSCHKAMLSIREGLSNFYISFHFLTSSSCLHLCF